MLYKYHITPQKTDDVTIINSYIIIYENKIIIKFKYK